MKLLEEDYDNLNISQVVYVLFNGVFTGNIVNELERASTLFLNLLKVRFFL